MEKTRQINFFSSGYSRLPDVVWFFIAQDAIHYG